MAIIFLTENLIDESRLTIEDQCEHTGTKEWLPKLKLNR